jgi:flagellar hook-associated protein 3 FlgL
MRITQRALAVTSLQGLNRNMDAIAKLQAQLTSGRTINKPSDDPTGTNAAMQTRQELAGATQYARNISDGLSQLNATDSALQNMIQQVQKVRDLTVQGSNAGVMSDASRTAISTEVAGLRDSLLGLANTKVQNQPIFGGVTGGPVAYDVAKDADGVAKGTYVGVGTTAAEFPVTRQVSEADSVRVDITGPEAFGVTSAAGVVPPTRDLFTIVGDIAEHVLNGPNALAADLDDLDLALQRMSKAAADIGTRTNRIETAKQVNSDLQLTLTSRSADIENVDLAKTIMSLQMQQTGYEAALGATAKAIQPTLLDFLR